MTARPDQQYSEQDYLAFERTAETRHEYRAGAIVAMTGASATHNIITANIIGGLHAQLRRRPCTVYPADMRLKIERAAVYTYPDITVVCGPSQFLDRRSDVLLNPTVLFEVLSPSTENYDRGQKAQYYRMIPSLQEYLLVAQHAPHVEHFVRRNEFQWVFSELSELEATVELPAIGCTLTLADIYEKAHSP